MKKRRNSCKNKAARTAVAEGLLSTASSFGKGFGKGVPSSRLPGLVQHVPVEGQGGKGEKGRPGEKNGKVEKQKKVGPHPLSSNAQYARIHRFLFLFPRFLCRLKRPRSKRKATSQRSWKSIDLGMFPDVSFLFRF